MKTFIGKTVTAYQTGANAIEFRFRNGNYFDLTPEEAHSLGEWLLTVEVPQVKPETRGEISLGEAMATDRADR